MTFTRAVSQIEQLRKDFNAYRYVTLSTEIVWDASPDICELRCVLYDSLERVRYAGKTLEEVIGAWRRSLRDEPSYDDYQIQNLGECPTNQKGDTNAS